jgi:cellulose synthase operon protein YhjQ
MIISIVSYKGGVGKTTVTANLAASLIAAGERVTIVDLDPQNALGLHFGISKRDKSGIMQQSLSGRPWDEVLHHTEAGLSILPYGSINETQRIKVEHKIEAEPRWLYRNLLSVAIASDDIILLDTPPGPSVYLAQALVVSNYSLAILLADAASFVTIPKLEALLKHYSTPHHYGCYYLINQMDAAKALSQDIFSVLRTSLYDKSVPFALHEDEAVSEALACQQAVIHYDPYSQAAYDFMQLSKFVRAYMLSSGQPFHHGMPVATRFESMMQ